MQALKIGSDKPEKTWCFWSTTESIQNDVPSVTGVVETLIAVPLYWWIALEIGMLPTLLVSAAVAPFVLLRSEPSVALGIKWLLVFETKLFTEAEYSDLSLYERRLFWIILAISIAVSALCVYFISDELAIASSSSAEWRIIGVIFLIIAFVTLLSTMSVIFSFFVPQFFVLISIFQSLKSVVVSNVIAASLIPGLMIGLLIITVAIRIGATAVNLKHGIKALPQNFRRLAVCTSPAQIPEVVPGIERTSSQLRFNIYLREIFSGDFVPKSSQLRFNIYLRKIFSGDFVPKFTTLVFGTILYLPAWLYRFTIKSTVWFWWPLALLGGELRQARNPDLFRWNLMGSLWARTSITLACLSLLAFAVTNLVLSGAVFQQNPLLTPFGYLLLIDWTPRLWQVCAVVGSALSLTLVFMLDHVAGEYQIARRLNDHEAVRVAERKFGWIERLSRLRLLLFIAFWLLVGVHAILYFNSQRCWFSVPPKLQDWAKSLYGDHLPPDRCLDRLPKASL